MAHWRQWSAMEVFVGEELDDKCGVDRRRWLARLGQAQHQRKVLMQHAKDPLWGTDIPRVH
jgi:hypothetical protein